VIARYYLDRLPSDARRDSDAHMLEPCGGTDVVITDPVFESVR
jgi:hypothetical protein